MRTSGKKTTAAKLRYILNSDPKVPHIKADDWAKMLGCSLDTIRSVESGRMKLSRDLATAMFHATGISVEWLLKGNPKAPRVAANGEPYTRKIFEETQAGKKWFDRQHPFLRDIDKLGFCAQLAAILENANTQEKYFMAAYNVGEALESLRKKFAPGLDAHRPAPPAAAAVLKPLVEFGEDFLKNLKKQQKRQMPRPSRRRARA